MQADQQVLNDGYNFITGVVIDNPTVKSVIITFSNGTVAHAPVTGTNFWFVGKVGTSGKDAYLKHLIEVSDQGDIISNQS